MFDSFGKDTFHIHYARLHFLHNFFTYFRFDDGTSHFGFVKLYNKPNKLLFQVIDIMVLALMRRSSSSANSASTRRSAGSSSSSGSSSSILCEVSSVSNYNERF